MTKQEGIREGIYYVPQSNKPDIQEGIAKWLHGASTNPWEEPSWGEIPNWRKDQYRKNAYFLMVKLDSQGVVIKVDRELPDYPTGEDCLAWYSRVQQDMLKWHNDSLEPLIEEEKGRMTKQEEIRK